MKHIKLFENWIRVNEPIVGNKGNILLGYFNNGGIGSHPGILTPEAAAQTGDEFFVTSEEKSVPQALLCIYNDMSEWDIKGITSSLARSIMDKIGGDHIDDAKGDAGLVAEIANMVGYKQKGNNTLISIIPNPTIDTIYWSDAPESMHVYWEPPYKAMPIDELIG